MIIAGPGLSHVYKPSWRWSIPTLLSACSVVGDVIKGSQLWILSNPPTAPHAAANTQCLFSPLRGLILGILLIIFFFFLSGGRTLSHIPTLGPTTQLFYMQKNLSRSLRNTIQHVWVQTERFRGHGAPWQLERIWSDNPFSPLNPFGKDIICTVSVIKLCSETLWVRKLSTFLDLSLVQ